MYMRVSILAEELRARIRQPTIVVTVDDRGNVCLGGGGGRSQDDLPAGRHELGGNQGVHGNGETPRSLSIGSKGRKDKIKCRLYDTNVLQNNGRQPSPTMRLGVVEDSARTPTHFRLLFVTDL